MSKTNDGGAVFPDPAPREDGWSGMSLRDWFAGMAMQGMLASPKCTDDMATVVAEARQIADIMLAEGEKRGKPE